MEFDINLAASLEILIPKGESNWVRSTKLGNAKVKQLKNEETKISMELIKRGKHNFSAVKKKIMDSINDADLPDRKIFEKLWIKIEIYDPSFISIYFDSGFMNFLTARDIDIHLENRS
ncbi:hypothetical protein [Sphingorhabdus sp. 109]|jgi:hypothetical protein|uniref:hypothetical protein n=1 Tax=Sphingorhabdus sp. 109 TaxID=2653173 RepID=UPI0012EFFA6D|nr:hypothetical protein [Sphingorhabdus sp. 109]VWX60729.1 hypothetical protein SPHINGOR109_50703 [Sphingorhabdus sp. 109]